MWWCLGNSSSFVTCAKSGESVPPPGWCTQFWPPQKLTPPKSWPPGLLGPNWPGQQCGRGRYHFVLDFDLVGLFHRSLVSCCFYRLSLWYVSAHVDQQLAWDCVTAPQPIGIGMFSSFTSLCISADSSLQLQSFIDFMKSTFFWTLPHSHPVFGVESFHVQT